jgi:hypothetical protein
MYPSLLPYLDETYLAETPQPQDTLGGDWHVAADAVCISLHSQGRSGHHWCAESDSNVRHPPTLFRCLMFERGPKDDIDSMAPTSEVGRISTYPPSFASRTHTSVINRPRLLTEHGALAFKRWWRDAGAAMTSTPYRLHVHLICLPLVAITLSPLHCRSL